MQAKVWPGERFVEIGRRLLADDRFEIVVLGGPADVELAQHLIGQWGDGLNAAGKFSVLGAAAVLKHCRFVFATDSGPMHLGASVDTPCVALFSGVDYPGGSTRLALIMSYYATQSTARAAVFRLAPCQIIPA